MEDIKKLIPEHKMDRTTIEKLKCINDEDMKVILYDLLFWLSDFNWPIASEIMQVISKRDKIITPYLKHILNNDQNNDELKYWVIRKLLPELPSYVHIDIYNDLKRVAYDATENEKYEEVDIEAKYFIDNYIIK